MPAMPDAALAVSSTLFVLPGRCLCAPARADAMNTALRIAAVVALLAVLLTTADLATIAALMRATP
jgi:hypothetical protein